MVGSVQPVGGIVVAKTLDQEPTFTAVKVTPTHAPPANVVSSQPFLKPSSSSQPSHRPTTSVSPATDHVDVATASKASSDSSQPSHRPETSGISSQPAKRSFSTAFDLSRRESSSSDSDSESVTSDRPPVDLYPEEGELSDDHEVSLTDPDQSLSEEQAYRETMRGIRSYMGWTHVPDLDSGTKTSDDNPFARPKLQNPGKVSVNLPTDEWLWNKLSKLNITLVQGYPSRTTEAGTLQRDQFVRPAKSQSKRYGVHSETKKDSGSTLKSWNTSSSRINSTYLRIARQAGIASNPPLSRPISQENLRKWERSARESSIICNQAAGFNRCVLKVQQNMHTQLRTIRTESKGKAASKVSAATDKLQFLLDFNSSVCQAMAKAMEHLTDFVFVNMANTTLLRRDSYLSYLKAGVKADTLNALRSAPLELDTLFPDSVIKQAEEDIANFDRNRSWSVYKKGRYHPYERQDRKSDPKKQDRPAWKNISSHSQYRRGKGKQCGQCPSCCKNSACRVQTSKLLANLAGSRCRSENSSNFKRGLHPSFPDPANSYKVSNCRKPLCQSPQEQLPVGGIASAYRQKCSGIGPQSNISGVLQSVIPSPKTQQQMEANTGPKQLKLFPQGGKIQNGGHRKPSEHPSNRGSGSLQ